LNQIFWTFSEKKWEFSSIQILHKGHIANCQIWGPSKILFLDTLEESLTTSRLWHKFLPLTTMWSESRSLYNTHHLWCTACTLYYLRNASVTRYIPCAVSNTGRSSKWKEGTSDACCIQSCNLVCRSGSRQISWCTCTSFPNYSLLEKGIAVTASHVHLCVVSCSTVSKELGIHTIREHDYANVYDEVACTLSKIRWVREVIHHPEDIRGS
jgi:hypothetical protein